MASEYTIEPLDAPPAPAPAPGPGAASAPPAGITIEPLDAPRVKPPRPTSLPRPVAGGFTIEPLNAPAPVTPGRSAAPLRPASSEQARDLIMLDEARRQQPNPRPRPQPTLSDQLERDPRAVSGPHGTYLREIPPDVRRKVEREADGARKVERLRAGLDYQPKVKPPRPPKEGEPEDENAGLRYDAARGLEEQRRAALRRGEADEADRLRDVIQAIEDEDAGRIITDDRRPRAEFLRSVAEGVRRRGVMKEAEAIANHRELRSTDGRTMRYAESDPPVIGRLNGLPEPQGGASTVPSDPDSFEGRMRALEADPLRQDQEAIADRTMSDRFAAKRAGAEHYLPPDSTLAVEARRRDEARRRRVENDEVYRAALADPFMGEAGSPADYLDPVTSERRPYAEAPLAIRHELYDRRWIDTLAHDAGGKVGPDALPAIVKMAERLGDALKMEGRAGLADSVDEKVQLRLDWNALTIDNELLPVVGGVVSLERMQAVKKAMERIEGGEGTAQDALRVRAWLAHLEVEGRERTVLGKAGAILTQLPGFMAEMVLSGGAVPAEKKVAKAAMMESLEAVLQRSLVRAASPVFAGRGAATAERRMLPKSLGGKEEPLGLALANAYGDTFIEVFSEGAVSPVMNPAMAGIKTQLMRVPGVSRVVALKKAVAGHIARKYPGIDFDGFLKEAGWDGVINEMLEERLGEVMRAAPVAPGVGPIEPYKPPTMEDLLAEAVAFSVIPGAQLPAKAAGAAAAGIERRERKGAADDTREQLAALRDVPGNESLTRQQLMEIQARGEDVPGASGIGPTGNKLLPVQSQPSKEAVDALARFQADSRADTGDESIELEIAAPTSAGEREVLRRAGDRVEVVFVRDKSGKPLERPGYYAPASGGDGGKGVLYVAAGESDMASVGLFHHEWHHDLEARDPSAFEELAEAIERDAPGLLRASTESYFGGPPEAAAATPGQRRSEGVSALAEDLTAAIINRRLTSRQLRKIAAARPGLARRMLAAVDRVLVRMGLGRVTGAAGRNQRRAAAGRTGEAARAILAFRAILAGAALRPSASKAGPSQGVKPGEAGAASVKERADYEPGAFEEDEGGDAVTGAEVTSKSFTKAANDAYLEEQARSLPSLKDQADTIVAAVGYDRATRVDAFAVTADDIEHLRPADRARLAGMISITDDAFEMKDIVGEQLFDGVIEELLGGTKGRVERLVESVLTSGGQGQDPELVLRAWMASQWPDLSDEQRRVKPLLVDPESLPLGTTVTVLGEPFEVAERAGDKFLRGEFRGEPLEFFTEVVPVDQGSIEFAGAESLPAFAKRRGWGRVSEREIVNPIDSGATPEKKVRQLTALSNTNERIIKPILEAIDAQLGTESKSSHKLPERILEKSRRPSIVADKPWHDVEHVRDSFRFKTVFNRFEDVVDAFKVLASHHIDVVKVDVNKMFHPKFWGWRFAAFDLRMPNRQLVEWYLPMAEMEEAKDEGHLIFEKWRNLTEAQIAARRDEYDADVRKSYNHYFGAFSAGLERLGLSFKAAEASWISLVASLESSTTSKDSSAGMTTPRGFQTPSADRRPRPETYTRPSGDLRTKGSESGGITPIIGENDEKSKQNVGKVDSIEGDPAFARRRDFKGQSSFFDALDAITGQEPTDAGLPSRRGTGAPGDAPVARDAEGGPAEAPAGDRGEAGGRESAGAGERAGERSGGARDAAAGSGGRDLAKDAADGAGGSAGRGGVAGTQPAGTEPAAGGRVRGSQRAARAADRAVARAARQGLNHVIGSTDSVAPRGNVAKFNANLEAIRLLKKLTAAPGNRFATADEQKVLVRYTGWGWAGEYFNESKTAYDKQRRAIRELLTDKEFAAARASTLNAHYTSPAVISAMWAMARRLGFKGGAVLEPSAGVGHFFGLMPADLAKESDLVGVELDDITAGILRQLYQRADIRHGGFEKQSIADNSIDLAISNVPFGSYIIAGSDYDNLKIHDYFFARGLDKVRPGGLVMFITSHYTLDKADRSVRALLAEKADLVAAVRLPATAFEENAGTEVTTDIVIFRKKDGRPFAGARPFAQTAIAGTETVKEGEDERQVPILVNEYFTAHPDDVIGSHSLEGSMYGGRTEYTVKPPRGGAAAVIAALEAATQRLPAGVLADADAPLAPIDAPLAGEDAGGLREFSFVEQDGDFYQVIDGKLTPAEWLTTKGTGEKPDAPIDDAVRLTRRNIARDWMKVREAVRTHLDLENNPGASDDALRASRQRLSLAYDLYVKRWGTVTRHKRFLEKAHFLEEDPDYPFVQAVEDERRTIDEKSGKELITYVKGQVFRARIRQPKQAPMAGTVKTVGDAVAVSLGYHGSIDPARIGELMGTGVEEAEDAIAASGIAMRNPATGLFETREKYLSGNVREKLRKAEESAKTDPQYQRNVTALTAVQPARISLASGLSYQLSSRWMPAEVIEAFATQALGTPVHARYVAALNSYEVSAKNPSTPEIFTVYGAPRMDGLTLLAHAVDGNDPVVYDVFKDAEGREKRVANKEATQQARTALEKITAAFATWVRTSSDTLTVGAAKGTPAEVVEERYNQVNNAVVAPQYSGEYLILPGATNYVYRKPHRLSVVARILQERAAVMAHGVGSGKTVSQIVAAMELRRLGLAKKPMIVVHKATIGQFAAEFRKAYPDAKLLVATERTFQSKHRKRFMSRIALGDYDAVVVTQPQFDQLPSSRESVERYFAEQLSAYEEAIRAEREEGGKKSLTQKKLEAAKKNLEARLERKLKSIQENQDQTVSFEDLGVDFLLVDEAHAYKRLPIITKKGRIKGVPGGSSNRAMDLDIKVRHVQAKQNGRGVVGATGTPVTNTMAEAFVMLKLFSPHVLEQYHIRTFDDFANTFGETQTKLEFTWKNTWELVTRFNKFTNGVELVTMIRSGFDVKMGNEKLGLDVPKMRGGKPELVITPQTKASDRITSWLMDVAAAYEELEPGEKRDASWVPIVTMGTGMAASVDPRLIDEDAADDPDSKVNTAVRRVVQIHRESALRRGVQLILADRFRRIDSAKLRSFLDIGDTDVDVEGEPSEAAQESEGAEDEAKARSEAEDADFKKGGFNLYKDIKAKLIAAGIPAGEIAIIHEASTDQQREQLFARVNAGQVRVMLGSTEKMGVGVNVQARLVAEHHLDPPRMMTPAMMEQRIGRIIRQGNIYATPRLPDGSANPHFDPSFVVDVLFYGLEKSMDTGIYQMLEDKGRFIAQVLAGEGVGRAFEDPADELVLNMGQMKAMLTGNPDALKQIELSQRLAQLDSERVAFENQVSEQVRRVAEVRRRVAMVDADIPREEAVADRLEKAFPPGEEANDAMVLVADGKKVTGRRNIIARLDTLIGEAEKKASAEAGIAAALAGISGSREMLAPFATFKGTINGYELEVRVTKGPSETSIRYDLRDPQVDYPVRAGNPVEHGTGLVMSVAATARNYRSTNVQSKKAQRQELGKLLPALEAAAKETWPKSQQLLDARRELDAVQLRLQGKTPEAEGDGAVGAENAGVETEKTPDSSIDQGGALARRRSPSGVAAIAAEFAQLPKGPPSAPVWAELAPMSSGPAMSFASSDAETEAGKPLVKAFRDDKDGSKTGLLQISQFLADALDVQLRTGASGKAGTTAKNPVAFIAGPDVIRSRIGVSNQVSAHDLGHMIGQLLEAHDPGFLLRHEGDLITIGLAPGSFATITQDPALPPWDPAGRRTTASEGFAELIRRYIYDPGSLDKAGGSMLGVAMPNHMPGVVVKALEKHLPDVLASVRDAHRMAAAWAARPLQARWRSYMAADEKAPPVKETLTTAGRMLDRFLFNLNAEQALSRRVRNRILRGLKKTSNGLMRAMAKKLENSESDFEAFAQQGLHVPGEVRRLLFGPAKHDKGGKGLRVLDPGHGGLPALMKKLVNQDPILANRFIKAFDLYKLKRSGTGAGQWIHLTAGEFDVQDIIKAVTRDGKETGRYAAWEAYVQMREVVNRARDRWDVFDAAGKWVSTHFDPKDANATLAALPVAAVQPNLPGVPAAPPATGKVVERPGMPYPGQTEGLDLATLMKEVASIEKAQPDFLREADRLNQFMNGRVLAGVLMGQFDAETALKIVETRESYAPLLRQYDTSKDEDRRSLAARMAGRETLPGAEPDSGVRRAFGSHLPLRPLIESIEVTLRELLTGYNQQLTMKAVATALETAAGLPGADAEFSREMRRIMVPVEMSMKPAATLTDEEREQWAKKLANGVNARRAKALGVPVDQLPANEQVTWQDLAIDFGDGTVWRAAKPGGINLLAIWDAPGSGTRTFVEVEDVLLFDYFTRQRDVGRALSWWSTLWKGVNRARRRGVLKNLGFIVRNFTRDPMTALVAGPRGVTAKAMIPGYFMAKGLLDRVLRRGSSATIDMQDSELWGEALKAVHEPEHQARATTIWGGFMATLAEGVHVPGWKTMGWGERAAHAPGAALSALLKPIDLLSHASGLNRLSDFVERLSRRGAYLAAIESGQTAARATLAYDSVTGNFIGRGGSASMNAWISTALFLNANLQVTATLWQNAADPSKRGGTALRLAIAGASGMVAALTVYLMMGDDDREKLNELPQAERLKNMHLPLPVVGGGGLTMRLPFAYGPEGAAQSWGYNLTMNLLMDKNVGGMAMAIDSAKRVASLDSLSGLATPAGSLALEYWSNKRLYDGGEVIPGYLLDELPEMQYGPETSEGLRKLGAATGVSPAGMEHFIGALGGRNLLNMVKAAESSGGSIDEIADVPDAGSLFARDPRGWASRSVQDLRAQAEEYDQARSMYKRLTEEGRMEDPRLKTAEATMARLGQAHAVSLGLKKIAAAIRQELAKDKPDREQIVAWERMMLEVAKKAGAAVEP